MTRHRSNKPHIRLHCKLDRRNSFPPAFWWRADLKRPRAHTAHMGLWSGSAQRAIREALEDAGYSV